MSVYEVIELGMTCLECPRGRMAVYRNVSFFKDQIQGEHTQDHWSSGIKIMP